MRYAVRFRALLAACASLLVAAGCSDSSGPDETSLAAYHLERLAESLNRVGSSDAAFPLVMASQSVRAGASLRTFDVTVDGVTSAWTGVATRMSHSETACEQLMEVLPGIPAVPGLCAPLQFTVAWDGPLPEPSRLLVFGGDTGSVQLGLDSFTGDELPGETLEFRFAFAGLHELDSDRLWVSDSGLAVTSELATAGACPRQPVGSARSADVSCRIATYRIQLGGRFRVLDLDGDPFIIGTPPGEQAGEARRISIAPQSLAGMHLEILRYPDGAFGVPRGVMDAGMQARAASPREPAALLSARMLLAR